MIDRRVVLFFTCGPLLGCGGVVAPTESSPADLRGIGVVELMSEDRALHDADAQARFRAGDPPCPSHAITGCTVVVCAADGPAFDRKAISHNAGPITVQADAAITIPVNGDAFYQGTVFDHAIWSPGETITAHAVGDDEIGPFALSAIAPTPVTIVSAPRAVDPRKSYTMTWSGGVVGDTEAILFKAQTRNEANAIVQTIDVTCEVDAAAGSFTVDPSVFADVPEGTRIELVTPQTVRRSAPIVVDGWSITLRLWTPDG